MKFWIVETNQVDFKEPYELVDFPQITEEMFEAGEHHEILKEYLKERDLNSLSSFFDFNYDEPELKEIDTREETVFEDSIDTFSKALKNGEVSEEGILKVKKLLESLSNEILLSLATEKAENSEEIAAELREKHSGKNKVFNSSFSDKDRELPYVFDLHFDIKSEGALKRALLYGTEVNPTADIEEMALDYGYTEKYLSKYTGEICYE